MDGPSILSSDELTWLQASQILDSPPPVPQKDQNIFMSDISISNSLSANYSASPPLLPNVLTASGSGNTLASPRPDSPVSSRRSASHVTPPRNPVRPTLSRSEWIYRHPKQPLNAHSRNATVRSLPPRPLTGVHDTMPPLIRSGSTATTRTTRAASLTSSSQSFHTYSHTKPSSSTAPFWSTILRPRSRSERSMPLLKTIPSQSQIVLTPTDETYTNPISSPRVMSARPPSVSSTLSSASTSPSPSSSRSESPVTPISISSSPYGTHRRHNSYHRRHRTHPGSDVSLPPISSSCPPSKSILSRTASVSTKDSRNTVGKSVKFAAIPIVHYASTGYWDLETIDDSNMGINVESMDVEEPFTDYPSHPRHNLASALDIAEFRELQCVTPTPERERQKANTLKRLMSLTRKPTATTGTSTTVAVAHKSPPSAASNRPTISTPYALGGHPSTALQSTASLRRTAPHASRPRKSPIHLNPTAAGSAPDLTLLGGVSLRSAPSCESFRSSKSAGTRSVRSVGSTKSTNSSNRGLRAWIGRTIGWTEG